MQGKRVAAVFLAVLTGLSAAQAQSVRDIPAPKETPPASFRGPQFVDSRGCVFIRAGMDGQVMWVPRVNAERKVLCGYPPTPFAEAAPAPAPVAIAPAVAPLPAAPDPATTAPITPVVVAEAGAGKKKTTAPAPEAYVDVPRKGTAPGTLRCPARAPIIEQAPLRGGGTVTLCVSRKGVLTQAAVVRDLTGAAPVPRPAKGSAVLACPAAAPTARTLPLSGGGSTVLCAPENGSTAALALPKRRAATAPLTITLAEPAAPAELLHPVVPKGYKLAWKDDRLNPNRGRGTALGQAQQDMIWSTDTPARLLTREERAKRQADAPLTVSTKGEGSQARYVQVGQFSDPANVGAASARLAGLGLPVAVAQGKRKVVLAGPFATSAEAKAALRTARRGGFPDAFLR